MSQEEKYLLELTQELLDCISNRDWETYTKLCDKDFTCFEPEASEQLISGLDFHKFYFDNKLTNIITKSTISNPNIRIFDSTGVVCYTRVLQISNGEKFSSVVSNETRIWRKMDKKWKLIHFHRSK